MNKRSLTNVSASIHQRLLNIARDTDFLANVGNSPENLAAIFREFCTVDDPDDGLIFDPNTVNAQRIEEDAEYAGVRTRLRGQLGKAQVVMQIDVGFGDLIHPIAVQADYPALLDMPAPSLRMYPPETVIAEKAETMVYLGSLNSRMKDFYDIWRISQQFDFQGNVLCEAVKGTFQNRNTEIIKSCEPVVQCCNIVRHFPHIDAPVGVVYLCLGAQQVV